MFLIPEVSWKSVPQQEANLTPRWRKSGTFEGFICTLKEFWSKISGRSTYSDLMFQRSKIKELSKKINIKKILTLKKRLLDRFPPPGAGWSRWRPQGSRCIWKHSGLLLSPSCVDAVWELVSAVSKTRARVEKNQMLPLAERSSGVPPEFGWNLTTWHQSQMVYELTPMI